MLPEDQLLLALEDEAETAAEPQPKTPAGRAVKRRASRGGS
jgi:hypothetical protein